MMRALALVLVSIALTGLWWLWARPPSYLRIAEPIHFDDRSVRAVAQVDQSPAFAAALERLDSALPGHDDIVFLADGKTALVSAMDGRLWTVDLASGAAGPFVDPPLMAAGLHEAPDHPGTVYFCASRLYGKRYPEAERPGVYRLRLATREIEAVVTWVPSRKLGEPTVYADDDDKAPELQRWGSARPRPLAFCNDLELSADGRRIYFSEPFAYPGASMGRGAVKEAVSLGANGRLWRYDLDTRRTRLIAQGFHFIDGVLVDRHPDGAREESLIVSQTPLFRLTRFFFAGPRAGQFETVIDALPGMPDGLDRDAHGRIWVGLIQLRSGLLCWLHANPWIKPLLLRLPLERLPPSRRTGVLVLSSDGAEPVYAATYEGPKLSQIASAIPGPGAVYLTPFEAGHRGIVRMPYPENFEVPQEPE